MANDEKTDIKAAEVTQGASHGVAEKVSEEREKKRRAEESAGGDSNKRPQQGSSSGATVPAVESSNPSTTASSATFIDVCETLGLKPGDRVEVQWEVIQDEDQVGASSSNSAAVAPLEASKGETRWWGATLLAADGRTHILTPDDDDDEGKTEPVKAPIRTLDYDPYPEGGFPERSLEDVVFLSDMGMMNLSSNSDMTWRREGAPSPPPPETTEIAAGFNNEEELRTILDSVIQSALSKTGMMDKMRMLPAANQAHIAEKIRTGKDMLVQELMGEGEKLKDGNQDRVITADIVKRCMEKIGQAVNL